MHSYWFRRDPVPNIRCRRGACYGKKYLRYPSTIPEMRQYYAHPEFVRAKRTPRYLPTCWDDVWRENCWHNKSWKLYRKHQWK